MLNVATTPITPAPPFDSLRVRALERGSLAPVARAGREWTASVEAPERRDDVAELHDDVAPAAHAHDDVPDRDLRDGAAEDDLRDPRAMQDDDLERHPAALQPR